MQVDVISLLSKLGVKDKEHDVPKQRMEELLKCLTKAELWEVCKEQPQCTAKAADAKDAIVSALISCQLQLGHLSKEQLKTICEKQGVPQTGNKPDLIGRLLHSQQPAQQDKPAAKQTKAAAKQEKVPAQQEKVTGKQDRAGVKQEPPAEQKKAPPKQCKVPAGGRPGVPGAPVVAAACVAPAAGQAAAAAAAAAPPPPAGNPARLRQYLCLLPKDLLQALAGSWELTVRANASAQSLAEALVAAGLQLTDLTVKQLQYICQVEQVARSGTKDEIVQRLEAAAQPAKAAAEDQVAAGLRERALEEAAAMARVSEALPDKQGRDGLMSRASYRNLLRANRLLEDDQDVYHIISSENGGADHICNYHYAQNAALNRSIGCRHDYLNAYLAGKKKTEAAVRVSRQYGNNKGQRYEGPSAEELYRKGEDTMRDLRHGNRDWFANNYAK